MVLWENLFTMCLDFAKYIINISTTKQTKTYICARCKKEITDDESKWIGNHRFCKDCAAPPKVATNNVTVKSKENAYESKKDKQQYLKSEDVYQKRDLQSYKKVIHSAGTHIMGELYEEVTAELCDGKYYYATLSMTDKFNAGGHREEIPKDFIVSGKVDEDSLLDYVAVTHTYMDTLSYRRDSAKLCSVCRKPIKNTAFKKINNHLLCELCFEKINNKNK